MVSPIFTFFLSCCDVLNNSCFLPTNWARTSYYSPSQNFPRKIFFFFLLFPFSSIQYKNFCEQIDLLFVSSRFYVPKKSPVFLLLKKNSLMKNILFFFFHQVFLASFFHHSLFLFITFRIHLCFSFPFLLDLLFS